jgi:hypothetical protein
MPAKCKSAVAIGVFLLGSCIGTALADDTPAEQVVAFNRLVAQRNQLFEKLQALDKQAAETIKREEEPVRVHAEQIAIEDQLDLVQVRLEMLAMRYDFNIPPIPVKEEADADATDEGRDGPQTAGTDFERGRQRALEELKKQTQRLLKSIDYDGFLKRTEPE